MAHERTQGCPIAHPPPQLPLVPSDLPLMISQPRHRHVNVLPLTSAVLLLERARKPLALYFAVGLALFAGSEPGALSLIW